MARKKLYLEKGQHEQHPTLTQECLQPSCKLQELSNIYRHIVTAAILAFALQWRVGFPKWSKVILQVVLSCLLRAQEFLFSFLPLLAICCVCCPKGALRSCLFSSSASRFSSSIIPLGRRGLAMTTLDHCCCCPIVGRTRFNQPGGAPSTLTGDGRRCVV